MGNYNQEYLEQMKNKYCADTYVFADSGIALTNEEQQSLIIEQTNLFQNGRSVKMFIEFCKNYTSNYQENVRMFLTTTNAKKKSSPLFFTSNSQPEKEDATPSKKQKKDQLEHNETTRSDLLLNLVSDAKDSKTLEGLLKKNNFCLDDLLNQVPKSHIYNNTTTSASNQFGAFPWNPIMIPDEEQRFVPPFLVFYEKKP